MGPLLRKKPFEMNMLLLIKVGKTEHIMKEKLPLCCDSFSHSHKKTLLFLSLSLSSNKELVDLDI